MTQPTPPPSPDLPPFNDQYGDLVKAAFREVVERDVAAAADLMARARDYAERGKPEFVLAYLVALPAEERVKRELLAATFERRAEITERRATELDAEHHRPFPLLLVEARKDRTLARQVRQGKPIRPYARAAKPLTVQ